MAGVASSPLDWSVASRSRGGTLGDGYFVHPVSGGMLVAVVDGIGHGDEAATATQEALRVLERHAEATPAELCQRCHEALRGTRGVAMGICRFDMEADAMSWIGIGTVRGLLMRASSPGGSSAEMLLQRPGTIGRHLPSLVPIHISVQRADLLVLATDGLRPDFEDAIRPGDAPKRVVDDTLSRFATSNDDALVLAARYLGRIG